MYSTVKCTVNDGMALISNNSNGLSAEHYVFNSEACTMGSELSNLAFGDLSNGLSIKIKGT